MCKQKNHCKINMQQHNLYVRYKISLRKKLFDLSEVAVNIRQTPYKYPTSLRSWCLRTFENGAWEDNHL